MSDEARCPSCGEPRPVSHAQGECPYCQARTIAAHPVAATSGLEKTLAAGPATAAADDATLPAGGVERDVTCALSGLETVAQSLSVVPRVHLREVDPSSGGPVSSAGSSEVVGLRSISSRYELYGEIARGGMGAVLKGRDSDLGRDLAIKVLLETHRDKPELVHRFIEEAQISGQLQHPGVVPVYELGAFADRRPYFTMKLVKGRTLAALIADRANLADDLPRFLGIFEQICQTMAYAHARGVIHRDLKPSNVMVGAFGEVQVMDWGLAKILKPRGDTSVEDEPASSSPVSIIQTVRSGSDVGVSQYGSVLGTPAYMAPEQARGEVDDLDERADVFGLGAILCEVLTGAPPYTGETHQEILRKAAGHEIHLALSHLDDCGADAELVALAKRCLAAEPGDRPRQAGALSDALLAYLASVRDRLQAAELARVEAQANAAHERTKRRLTLVTATGLMALVILGGTAMFRVSQVRQGKRNQAELKLKEQRLLYEQAALDPRGDLAKWGKALRAADDAETALADVDDSMISKEAQGLRKLIEQGLAEARRDRALLDRLDEIRATRQGDEDMDSLVTTASYADAFRTRGLDLEKLPIDKAAEEIKNRPPRLAIEEAAILDDWAALLRISGRQPEVALKLLRLAERIDPDPWRSRLRSILALKTPEQQLERLIAFTSDALADLERLREQPVQGTILLAYALEAAGDRPSALAVLRNAQRGHPGDVWVNLKLADTLSRAQPPDPEETVRYYSIAQALNPAAAFGLAQYYHIIQSKNKEAVAIFEDLVRLQPEEALYHLQLALALRAGEAQRARKELELAANLSRQAAAKRPEIAWIDDTVLGTALVQLGDNDGAIAAYKEAIRLRPDYATAYNDLGIVENNKNHVDRAIELYQKAIRLRPDYIYAHGNLCTAYCQQGDYDKAKAALDALYRIAPGSPRVALSLGMVADYLAEWYRWGDIAELLLKAGPGQADKGLRRFQCALALLLSQSDQKAYRQVCREFYNDHGQTSDPLLAHYLLRACVLAPDSGVDLGPLLARGESGAEALPLRAPVQALGYLRAGQLEEAVRRAAPLADKANTQAGRLAVLVLALAHQKLGHADEAKQWLKKAMQIDTTLTAGWFNQAEIWVLRREAYELIEGEPAPEEPEIAFGRAQVLYKKGDRAGAQAVFEGVIAARPGKPRLLLERANIYRALGENDLARADCKQMLVLANDKVTKLRNRADMLAAWSQWADAAAGFERAIALDDSNPPDIFRLAPVLVTLEQDDKYRALCQRALEKLKATGDAALAERLAKTCLLRPASGEMLEQAKALLDKALDLGPDDATRAWFELTWSLAEYRAEEFGKTIDSVKKNLDRMRGPRNVFLEASELVLLSMATHKQGQHAEASQLLDRARARLRGRPRPGSPAMLAGAWYDSLVTDILLAEATAMIDPAERSPAPASESKK